MILRLAVRSLAARPVRSSVLACGFGFGVAVMAGLLGIGEVILEQARSPALRGGGDVVITGATGRVPSARFVLSSVLGMPPLAGCVAAASPASRGSLYLLHGGDVVAVDAQGGIPSLERAIGDPETFAVESWTDAASDGAWSDPDPADVLRAMDRFHPIPDVPSRSDSWAEWLYFNGHAGDARFYLSFIVGPRASPGRRSGLVRLQLERRGRSASYSDRAEVSEPELLSGAPDLAIGGSRVRLEGLVYRIPLELRRERAGPAEVRPALHGGRGPVDLRGEIRVEALPGRALPPFTVRGAGGWVSGYVVPVLSGTLGGSLEVEGEVVSLEGGQGYHDHNWGFWEGVSWQWGTVAGPAVSIVYGRIHPPLDAADPERIPGFLAVLGSEGPLGFSTDVRIREIDHPAEHRPRRIEVRSRGDALDLSMDLDVETAERTPLAGSPVARPEGHSLDFIQMRGSCRVAGTVATRTLDFTARASAETFRSP